MVHVLGLSFAACGRSYTLLHYIMPGQTDFTVFVSLLPHYPVKQRRKKKPVCTGLLRHLSIIQLVTDDFTDWVLADKIDFCHVCQRFFTSDDCSAQLRHFCDKILITALD